MSGNNLEPFAPLSDEQWSFLSTETLDKWLQRRPEDPRFCAKCVQSNQRPRIQFDDDGVCSACRYWEKKDSLDWQSREQQLEEILKKHRSASGRYDVIVPGSGGKDSAYVAHQLKHRWGMHPLTVTWAPFAYTSIGQQNLDAFIHSGFDNLLATPNGLLHRKLTLLSTALVGDPFLPFIWGQISYAFHLAIAFHIPLVFFGENGEAEYGGSTETEELSGMPIAAWSDNYWKGVTPHKLVQVGRELDFISVEEQDAMSRFYFPPEQLTQDPQLIENYWFGYFQNWKPQENFYYCVEHTGFQANPEGRSESTYSKYASLDDRIDGFHYYFGLLKFGVGRATSDAAHEIREGLIDREEGVALVRQYDLEFPERNFDFFLNYTGLDQEKFHDIESKFRAPHLWQHKNGAWGLTHPIWET